jgi:hypothetical protein
MERASKLFVLGWTCAALAGDVWLLRGGWPGLPVFALIAFGAAAILTAIDRRAVGIVLALTYLFPVLVYLLIGRYYAQYSVIWLTVLLGAMFPRSLKTSWNIPGRWRGALVCWALIIIAGASIVIAREVDFTLGLIQNTTISNTARGGWPAFIVSWVLHVALVLLTGILWFDWLFGTSTEDFHSSVATPMAGSFFVLALVSAYQLFVDLSFLNGTVFVSLARATGTMFDANVCGAAAALWIGGSILWAQRLGRWRPHAVISGAAAGWLAVWASGSRTAFAAAMIVTLCSIVALYVAPRRASRSRRFASVAAATAAAGGLMFILASADVAAVGPLRRLWFSIPSFSAESLQAVAQENLWTRNGYGTASAAMIRGFPWFGVGVGSFQSLLPEFSAQVGVTLPPDNAQNWYRHQLAELGIVGSLPWIIWVVAFGFFVLGRHTGMPAVGWTARGVILAFAAISFVGMPGQDAIVAITFWTMAFWYVRLVGVAPPTPLKPSSWAVIAVALAIFTAGTLHAAANELRVPVRAQRGGWPYSYGLYADEPDGQGGKQRWTGRRAVAVFPASSQWMALTVSVDHRAISPRTTVAPVSRAPTRPVDAKVWCNGELVLEKRLTTTAPETQYVRVPDGDRWVLLETWVNRILSPRDFGVPDDRELGMMIMWSFVDQPPSFPK